jgi:hypothetical protein
VHDQRPLVPKSWMLVSIVHVMDLAKTPQYPVAQSMNVVPPLALDS